MCTIKYFHSFVIKVKKIKKSKGYYDILNLSSFITLIIRIQCKNITITLINFLLQTYTLNLAMCKAALSWVGDA